MSDLLKITRDGPVAILTLNRPDSLNALNKALRKALVRTLANIVADATTRVIVLTGAGERAFTAGVDLKEAGTEGMLLGIDEASKDFDLARAMTACPLPIIGAINGFAITGGLELALLCDCLYASTHASFADTHARVGVMPGWGLSQRLSRVIGISRAKEISLSGNYIDAQTALDWGLVNRIFAPEALLPAAVQLAQDIAKNDPKMVLSYKAVIDEGFAQSFGDGLELESQRAIEHIQTIDANHMEKGRQRVLKHGRDQT